jgi:hypothetical protein
MKVGSCNLHALYVCVSVYPLINIWMSKPVFMKLGRYIMARGTYQADLENNIIEIFVSV